MTSKILTEREVHALDILKKASDRASEVLRECQRKRTVLETRIAVREVKRLFGFEIGDNLSFKRRIGFHPNVREITKYGVLEVAQLGYDEHFVLKVRYVNKRVEWLRIGANGFVSGLWFDIKKVEPGNLPKPRKPYVKREEKTAVIIFTKDNTIIAGPIGAVNPKTLKDRIDHMKDLPDDGKA